MRWPCLLSLALALACVGCGSPDSATEGSASTARSSPSGSVSLAKLDEGPRAAESPADEAAAERGERIFQDKGCSACHAFGRKMSGPDLNGVAARRTAQWMESQILEPERMVKEDPISRQLFAQHALQMPDQGLTQEEARAVIEYFKHKEQEAGESDED